MALGGEVLVMMAALSMHTDTTYQDWDNMRGSPSPLITISVLHGTYIPPIAIADSYSHGQVSTICRPSTVCFQVSIADGET